MSKKTELKVVTKGEEKEIKPTKAQIKKAEREEKERIKKQAEFQAKQMDQQITAMGKAVKDSICNQCVHCINPNKDYDRFKVKSSHGYELYTPMNFCKANGMSMTDVIECEKFNKA